MIIDRLDIAPDVPVWFAMQATQRREFIAQNRLREDGIDSFIPMRNNVVIKNGRKELGLVPVISNLMFVYASKNYMREVQSKIPFLQFKCRTEGGLYYPIVVPTKEMEDFIKLYQTADREKMLFLDPSDPAITSGQRVRIHSRGDKLDGLEGTLIKVSGKRNRQFSISIGGITALATAVDIDLLEVLE